MKWIDNKRGEHEVRYDDYQKGVRGAVVFDCQDPDFSENERIGPSTGGMWKRSAQNLSITPQNSQRTHDALREVE